MCSSRISRVLSTFITWAWPLPDASIAIRRKRLAAALYASASISNVIEQDHRTLKKPEGQ